MSTVAWTFPFNVLMLTSSCMLAFGHNIWPKALMSNSISLETSAQIHTCNNEVYT